MTLSIDIGSNTIKCLLGENVEGKVEKLYESTLNCRISAGAGIIPDASRKIAQCVNFFISEAEEFCLNFDVKMVATSALRDSAKGGCICDDVFKLTGYRIKILSGDEEARLSYAGAMSDGAIDKSSESAFFDLGGGSMEVVFGKSGEVREASSLRLGAVRLAKMFGADGIVGAETIEKMSAHVRDSLESGLSRTHVETLVGAGGAVVAARFLKKAMNFGGAENVITVSQMREMLSAVSPLTVEERVLKYEISAGRADIVPAAFVAIIELMDYLGRDALVHTFHNIRYGLILSD